MSAIRRLSKRVGYRVRELAFDEAAPFIREWHYSHSTPKGSNYYYGCDLLRFTSVPWPVESTLYAVANYGCGINPFQASYLRRTLHDESISHANLVELKRLCRIEPRHNQLQLSAFIAACHRLLRKDYGIRHIVSFSDPAYGHNGGIYKASNFIHLGTTGQEMHVVDKDGVSRHRRYAYRYSRRNNCTIDEARKILGLTPVRTPAKDRWYISI